MFWIIVPIAMLLSVALIVMVLLQPSKGGGMGGAFGALGSSLGSTFGSRRTLDFLAKGTTWVAGALAVLCILANLAIKSGVGSSSVDRNTPVTQGASTGNAPASVPVTPPGGAQPGAQQAAPAPDAGKPADVQAKPADVQAKPVEPKPAGK